MRERAAERVYAAATPFCIHNAEVDTRERERQTERTIPFCVCVRANAPCEGLRLRGCKHARAWLMCVPGDILEASERGLSLLRARAHTHELLRLHPLCVLARPRVQRGTGGRGCIVRAVVECCGTMARRVRVRRIVPRGFLELCSEMVLRAIASELWGEWGRRDFI